MTFSEFTASRRAVEDVTAFELAGASKRIPGWIYGAEGEGGYLYQRDGQFIHEDILAHGATTIHPTLKAAERSLYEENQIYSG
jgi:hypothetical protein